MKSFFKISLLAFLFSTNLSFSQTEVHFKSADGLTITANEYIMDSTYSFIVMFHQAGYSKGEYIYTAKKLLKLKYNVLAVDLRSGGTVNYIPNQTALEAKRKGFKHSHLDAWQDIKASIDYAYNINNKKVIIFGSSYSASLCLMEAVNNDKVKAVIAFSPGEYFEPKIEVAEKIKNLHKKTFVAATQQEEKYVKILMANVNEKYKTIFIPKEGNGLHGSKALWKDCPQNKEYWLNLFLFFKQVQ